MFTVLLQRVKLTRLLALGFGLMLLCIVVTVCANLSGTALRQASTDRLVDHLYPARQSGQVIVQLALALDDQGAWYVLSQDPHQQAQVLHAYQQNIHALHVAIARATTLADTSQQRSALADLTRAFFGNGGYTQDTQQAFAQRQAGQQRAASENYVNNPLLLRSQHDVAIYTTTVEREIAQEDAAQDTLTHLVSILSIGIGASAVFWGLMIAAGITRVISRLYRRVEETNTQLTEKNTRLQALSSTDPLTNLPNHRALLTTIRQEVTRAQRYGRACSLLFLDLDHFKALNDTYGHAAGDDILVAFGEVLKNTIRSMDTVGRWGGEEFVVVLPEASSKEALEIAERIRTAVSFHRFGPGASLHLTCSIGVATSPEDGTDPQEVLSAADQAMYGAKHLGRNQVRVVSDPAVTALRGQEAAEGGREELALRGTVEALVTLVEERDQSLGHHSQQVGTLASQLARASEMSAEDVQSVALAGLLHDIGKVAISDAILQNPGRLTQEEWTQMKRHPIVGAEVLDHIPSLRPLVPVIRAHHERWDGQGYPDHLKAEQIPLAARLISVVDTYLVMISGRPYQPACSSAEALAEVRRCAGTQLDPHVVETLIALLPTPSNQSHPERMTVA